jgi:hypothetical protein
MAPEPLELNCGGLTSTTSLKGSDMSIDRLRLDRALLEIRLTMLEVLIAKTAAAIQTMQRSHPSPSLPILAPLQDLEQLSELLQTAMPQAPSFQGLADAERALLQEECREMAEAMMERMRPYLLPTDQS